MKALKVVIAVIIVVVIIGLVVFIGASMYAVTTINLLSNSVYYAQRMPHKEGTEPDLVMLIENMGEIILRKLKVFAMMMMERILSKILLIQVVILQVLVSSVEVITTVIKTMYPISLIRILSLSGLSIKSIKKLILQQLMKQR